MPPPRRIRRPRNAAPTRLGDLVQQTAPGKAAAQRVLSRTLWETVAGVGFARRTRPSRLHRGTLYVVVASAGWAQELALVERVVLDRLRAQGVEVERLRYEVGEVDLPDRGGVYAPPKEEIVRAQQTDVPEEAARALAKVRDPGLREVIAKAARAAARRKAEVDVKESAAKDERAIPRLPGEKFARDKKK